VTASAEPPGPAAAGLLARRVPPLLRDRPFRRYWNAQTISLFGDQIGGIAMPLAAVLILHAGAADMGYLTALEWLPSLLFALPVGAWVDRRGHRRATMIAADLGRFAVMATVPVCYGLGVLSLGQLFAVAFCAGTLSIAFNVSDVTLFVALVPDDQYVEGNSLVYASRALSYVGGPSVGGLLVQLLSAPLAIAADALSFLGSALLLHRIRPAEPPPDPGRGGSATAGIGFIRGSGIVRASLLASATINFFNFVFFALFILYATRALHVRAGVLGLVLGAGAVGGVLGAAVTRRLAAAIGVGWAYVAGCVLFTAPLLLIPLARGPMPVVLALLFLAEFGSGFGVMVLDISMGSMFAALVPDQLRSRVAGAFQAVNYGTRPVGALAGGALGTLIGLRPTLWIAAAGGLAGSVWLLSSPLPRFRMPAAAQPGSDPPKTWDAARDPGRCEPGPFPCHTGAAAAAAGKGAPIMTPESWRESKRYAEIRGHPMAYVEQGQGSPIIFLHGNPTSSYLWRSVMPELAGHGRCIAPDLIGMGDSGKLPPADEQRYTFSRHRDFLDGLLESLGVTDNVTLVVHDWGSALGFDWARRHAASVRGIAYMEAIVRPLDGWAEWPGAARSIFQRLRSPAGEEMILEGNAFVERILPASVLRPLSDEEMGEYRRPFIRPGDDRLPTLTWPRQIPIAGDPADVAASCADYARWLAAAPGIPKLFVNAEPGIILTGAMREFCRTWPDQSEVTVPGAHFIQEDSGPQIGQAIAAWLAQLA
jgi:pimeloyl-ACP methyl ester carboxylesterase/MFS family permease